MRSDFLLLVLIACDLSGCWVLFGEDDAIGFPKLKFWLLSSRSDVEDFDDTVFVNTEKVLLSAESMRSYRMVEWFGALHTLQNHETDEFARWEYSWELIPVHAA